MISWVVSGVSHGCKGNDQQDEDGGASHGCSFCWRTNADVKQLNTLDVLRCPTADADSVFANKQAFIARCMEFERCSSRPYRPTTNHARNDISRRPHPVMKECPLLPWLLRTQLIVNCRIRPFTIAPYPRYRMQPMFMFQYITNLNDALIVNRNTGYNYRVLSA